MKSLFLASFFAFIAILIAQDPQPQAGQTNYCAKCFANQNINNQDFLNLCCMADDQEFTSCFNRCMLLNEISSKGFSGKTGLSNACYQCYAMECGGAFKGNGLTCSGGMLSGGGIYGK